MRWTSSLMFADKAKSLPYNGTLKVLHSGRLLAHAQTFTRLESPAKGKHSNSLPALVNYGRKKFYNVRLRKSSGK